MSATAPMHTDTLESVLQRNALTVMPGTFDTKGREKNGTVTVKQKKRKERKKREGGERRGGAGKRRYHHTTTVFCKQKQKQK